MSRDERYEGNFLESADMMTAGEIRLTIKAIVPPNTERDSAKKLIKHPIISFEGTDKRLVCNATNERCIKSQFGSKAATWIGKQIVLRVNYLAEAFGEKNVPTLRVINPDGVPVPMAARKWMGQDKPFTKEEN
jgi:hypothetical protein